jgi:dTDP-4-amino-4,6-dideoxygalactose transaminase
MKQYVAHKKIDYLAFKEYLEPAHETNQFTNGGWAAKELEERAKDMLKIDNSKAVIATSSGTSALHAIIFAYQRHHGKDLRVVTQDFNFPSASQGPATGPIIVDFNERLNVDISHELASIYGQIYIITNCFGHLQDLEDILTFAQANKKIIIFDNAATPYSFFSGINSCNLGNASFISLHHTKPIGFGEGGLAIVEKHLEEQVRIACNFGFVDSQFNERGSNFKISDIAAASILQYWDSFDIDDLKNKTLDSYYDSLFAINQEHLGEPLPNFADEDNFLPSCLPFLHSEPISIKSINNSQAKKYYTPLNGLPYSRYVYDRIICYPLWGKND